MLIDADPELCKNCGKVIHISIFKGTGACCVLCAKAMGKVELGEQEFKQKVKDLVASYRKHNLDNWKENNDRLVGGVRMVIVELETLLGIGK